jgi:replicative DNA helicase
MATLAFPVPAVAEPQQLPRNVEAEAAMLGAMMIDNRLADDLVDKLEPGHSNPFTGASSRRSRRCVAMTCW